MIARLAQIVEAARAVGPRRVAVLWPCQGSSLQGYVSAQEQGLAQCTLIGDRDRILEWVEHEGVSFPSRQIVHEPAQEGAIRAALALCTTGRADLLVNEGASLRLLLPAVLDPEIGLRSGRLLSGVSVVEPLHNVLPQHHAAALDRLLLVSDGLMVVAPGLTQRIAIVQNAIEVAHRLQIDVPRVALLAASETVDLKSPVSVDAAQITVMSMRKQIQGAIVDGPLGFDNAISLHAAQVKGIVSDVSGQVDILIAPDLESGNLLLKTLVYLCRARAVNVVVGGKVPLVLSLPDDDAEAQVSKIALGVLLT
jgi:phosphate butyryltransferase